MDKEIVGAFTFSLDEDALVVRSILEKSAFDEAYLVD